MNTILRFILFFLLAPAFAIAAQAAGVVQDDFRIVDTGLRVESLILESVDDEICNYDSSGTLLHQCKSIDGEDDLSQFWELETLGATQPLSSFLAELVATNKIGHSVDDLSRAAGAADRGGLTSAGRALQKHGGREGSAFPSPTGNPTSINQAGQNVVDDILTTPGAATQTRHHARFGDVIEVRTPGGRGVRYDSSGNFLGLLEP